MNTIAVSALVARIRNTVRNEIPLNGLLIQGEVSNLTKHRSGHYYFCLKDSAAQIDCVMFSSYAKAIGFDLQEGMSVLAGGYVDVYEQRGQLQLYVRSLKPDGIGALYAEFEKNKRILSEEGIFAAERKKPKPHGIQKIGIVSSKEGAGLHDVLATIASRWPMAELHLFPTLVQGKGAPRQIIKALDAADHAGMDAILLVRGGGSFEDLFCFSNPDVARKVANMNTYTVTGIGHEVDTSLADYAADTAMRTPTAAAQWIVPDQKDVWQWFENKRMVLVKDMQSRIDNAASQLMQFQHNPYLMDPASWVAHKKLELKNLRTELARQENAFVSLQKERLTGLQLELVKASPASRIEKDQMTLKSARQQLETAMKACLVSQSNILARRAALLDACSPLKVLGRGYSIVTGEKGIITDPAQVSAGETVAIRLAKGQLHATIEKETS